MDAAGNLYGTTEYGGVNNKGTVFKLAPDGTETVLYFFTGGSDGAYAHGGVMADKKGNLYGTTVAGGKKGLGVVFRLAPDGTETVLHSFTGRSDGGSPFASVIKDAAGNLYGTTVFGGSNRNSKSTVVKLAPGGTETALHVFAGGSDGLFPYRNGYGTVFRLAPDGTETVLHVFASGSDGAFPYARLIKDTAGNLYGTTSAGGVNSKGTIFKLAPDGTETALYSFAGRRDGADPQAGLIMDAAGNLYGTTIGTLREGNGTVFKLAPDGTETVLHFFTGGSDGAYAYGGVIADKKGHLYGTTLGGGAHNDGTVFKLEE